MATTSFNFGFGQAETKSQICDMDIDQCPPCRWCKATDYEWAARKARSSDEVYCSASCWFRGTGTSLPVSHSTRGVQIGSAGWLGP